MTFIRLSSLVLCLLQLGQVAYARPSLCRWPAVNKVGFRPGSVVRYTTLPSPGGSPFPATFEQCVDRAFDSWSHANAATGLNVRFERASSEGAGIRIRFDRRGGLAVPRGKGGGWAAGVRGTDGYLEQAHVWLSSDERLLDSCDGVTKVLLHELGHLHGLRDLQTYGGPSVMNRVSRRNDAGGRIPLEPTPCDAQQAARAVAGLTVASLQSSVAR